LRNTFESKTWDVDLELALRLLFLDGMKIEVRPQEPGPNLSRDGSPGPVEVLEGGDEFLEAISMRLNEIIRKPSGRFVISYVPGQPGSKTPPRVQ
jgi:hypothetical protein